MYVGKYTTLNYYHSNVPVTFRQGQGDQTCHKLVNPKQGYNNTHFEKTSLEQYS